MRFIPIVLAALLCGGCGNQPYELGQQASQSLQGGLQADGKGRAFIAANAALATQMALYHVLAAFTQASQQDLGSARPLATLGSVDPESLGTYQVDLNAHSGTVKTVRKGRTSVDLAFTFTRVDAPHGFAYDVTTVTGTVEGYEVAIAPVSIRYDRVAGPDGQDAVNADGSHAWDVAVNAGGQLSYQGDVAARLDVVGFNLAWPVPAQGAQVGTLQLTIPGQDAVFTGAAFVAPEAMSTKATVTISASQRYDLAMDAAGKLEITPAQ